MSRPKELNFFVSELNWPLGRDWYAGHFDPSARIRGESSPHYTNRPSFNGVPGRMRELLGSDVRLVYVVRDPIDRMLSHYLHNVGGGYEDRSLADALADPESSYVARSRYFFQVDPYLEQFEREWETGVAKTGSRFRLMDRAVRLPGLRAIDRNFDRLPESLRWLAERVVHDPDRGEVAKPEVPDSLRRHLVELFRDDTAELERLAGRSFGWLA
jgi:hypothetical protein